VHARLLYQIVNSIRREVSAGSQRPILGVWTQTDGVHSEDLFSSITSVIVDRLDLLHSM